MDEKKDGTNRELLKEIEKLHISLNDIEAKLKSLKEFNENIVESMPVGVAVVDTDGRITAINRTQEELFGLKKHEVRGKVMYEDYLQKIKKAMQPLLEKAVSEGKKSSEKNVEYGDHLGVSRTFDISISPLIADGKITGAVIATRDMTERKVLKEKVRILEKKEIPLTDNDRLVYYGLITYPEMNNKKLAKKLKIKRTTLTGIKNKLRKKGFYYQIRVPNLPALGYDLLSIEYGNFTPSKENIEDALFRNEMNHSDYVNITATDNEYYAMIATKSISEYLEKIGPLDVKYDGCSTILNHDTVHFPFSISKVWNLFGYSAAIKNWFKFEGEDKEKEPLWKNAVKENLTKNEGLVLYALTKYPELSDKEISEKTGLSKITVSQIKKRHMDRGMIRTVRMPSLQKLGCELLLLVHGRFNPAIDQSAREKLVSGGMPYCVYIEDVREAALVIPFRDFTEYKTVYDRYIEMQNKNALFIENPKTVLIPVNKIKIHKLDFAEPVRKTLGITDKI